MPIFDTHAHYDSRQFDSDREAVLSALPGAGVGLVLDPGCDLPSSRAAAALASSAGSGPCPSPCSRRVTPTASYPACCTSRAATLESTPPLMATMALLSTGRPPLSFYLISFFSSSAFPRSPWAFSFPKVNATTGSSFFSTIFQKSLSEMVSSTSLSWYS